MTSLRNAVDAAVAAIALISADLMIRMLPFGVIAKRLRRDVRSGGGDPERAIKQVRWAVDAALRRIPWTIPCLAAAVAANRLLAHRGVPSEIRFGVQKPDDAIRAHAWLIAGGVPVTGGEAGEFVALK